MCPAVPDRWSLSVAANSSRRDLSADYRTRTVRDSLRAFDPTLPALSVDTLDDQVDHALVRERLLSTLAEFFGGVAMFLTAVGLYGVIAYVVARRTRELGLRMALGATPRDLIGMVYGRRRQAGA